MIKLLGRFAEHLKYTEMLINPTYIVTIYSDSPESGARIGLNGGGSYHVIQTPYQFDYIITQLKNLNFIISSL